MNCAGIVGPNGVKVADVSLEAFDMVYKGELVTCRVRGRGGEVRGLAGGYVRDTSLIYKSSMT